MSPALAVVFGPLAATAAILLVRRWCGAIAIVGAAVSLVAAGFALADVARGIESATIVPGLPGMPLRLTADPLGALLALTVAVVSFLIFTYAAGAMAGDPGQTRFFAGMAFFAAAMQTLVLAGDWLLFLAAWELIGFASYLLIGFWFARPGVGGAATRAFTTTRAADLGLYLGVFILTAAAGTTAIAASRQVGGAAAAVAGLALLVAAIGKSAQVPLQGWLQDAMVGPTSVSALLHSATLVVAGVVLLSRADPLLTPDVRFAIGVVGGVTAVVAGLSAVAQRDVKRLLAASTSSQIGLMLLALGAGSVAAAVVHLVANAAMKSALFLGVGVFQHDRDSTAFAALAGVGRERRGVFAAVVVAGLALAGIPPLAGFWSKDAVIAAALDAPTALALAPLALAGALLTGIYVARMLRLLWGDASDGGREPEAATAESIAMGTGLAGLTALAAILGLALEPIGRLLGVDIPSGVGAVALGLGAAVVGLAAGWTIAAPRLLGPAFAAALRGFRLDGGLDGLVVRPALALGRELDRRDRALHRGVLAAGVGALGVGRGAAEVDARLHTIVVGVGRAGLDLAAVARTVDAGIDRLISDLVAAARSLGRRARGLQTGLVHRELLLAAGAAAIVIVLLVLF